MTNTEEIIIYSNSRNGLGIRILGAKRATNKSGIYIKQILDDGLAQKEGRLKVGDQILSINDETSIGISREHAVNILRSAAATNQVRLRIKHFLPTLSSAEYQKLLYDEKSTDDDEDNHRQTNRSINNISNEVRMRKSSRRHHQQQQNRHTTYDLSQPEQDQSIKGLDVSRDALQALLNSKFKLVDLLDLLKKAYPKLFSNDQKRELQFLEQLSGIHSDGRITLKEFERQSSVFLGERINLLTPFYSSTPNSNDTELHREIASSRVKIAELETKINTCEKSQRLSHEVELEYEDLLKYLSEQLHQCQIQEINQSKQLRAKDQLIQKLFHSLSTYVNQPNDEHLLAQLKYEYEQQQRFLSNSNNNTSIGSTNKDQQRF